MDGSATRLRLAASTLVESAWLAALVATPILFNAGTDRTFEEPKVLLLRSLAGVMFAGLVVWSITKGRAVLNVAGRSLRRVPLLWPLILFTGMYVVSTALSINPHVSLWGAYRRSQGLYAWLSYVTFFVAILLVARRPAVVERLVTVAILASLPAAVYGILQHFGADPFRWDPGGDRLARITSTAGNPIFLGAFMIMVVPLVLARALVHGMAAQAPRTESRAHLWHLGLAAVYALILVVDLVVILYSRSMGPLLGLAAGLTVFSVVVSFQHRWWRSFASTIGAAGAAAIFLVVLNLPGTPLARLYSVKYVNDLARIAQVDHGPNRVRALIWEGTLALLAADPWRGLIGYGPEAMSLVYGPYYPAALAHYESTAAMPDRAHNETLDILVTVGAIGGVAQLLVFGCLFFCALQGLGMIPTLRQRRTFFAVVAAGAILGIAAPRFFEGSFLFSALGLAAGITLGVVTYIVAYALQRWNETPRPSSANHLVLIGVLAGAMAHFVEIQVGIGVVVTRLYFFTWAALAVLLGMRAEAAHDRSGAPVDDVLLQSGVISVGLIVLTFDFYRRDTGPLGSGIALVILLTSLWVAGALLTVGEAAVANRGADQRFRPLTIYASSSLGLWLAFTVAYGWWQVPASAAGALPLDRIRLFGAHLAHANTILYGFVLSCIAVPAAVAFCRAPGEAAVTEVRAWHVLLSAVAMTIAIALIWMNLNGARADSVNGVGVVYEQHSDFAAARILYEEASQLQPSEETYVIAMGRMDMEHGRSATGDTSPRGMAAFIAAEAAMHRAQKLNPLNIEATRNMARVHRLRAGSTSDSTAQAEETEQAARHYAAAVQRTPFDVGLRNEWATLYLERGELAKGMSILNESLAVDERNAPTYSLRASAYVQAGALDAALHDYDSALSLKPNLPEALSGKAAVLVRLNRLDEAIATNLAASGIAPGDVIIARNLALLYWQTGQVQSAIAQAEIALSLATPAEQPAVQQFIEQLTAERAHSASSQ